MFCSPTWWKELKAEFLGWVTTNLLHEDARNRSWAAVASVLPLLYVKGEGGRGNQFDKKPNFYRRKALERNFRPDFPLSHLFQ